MPSTVEAHVRFLLAEMAENVDKIVLNNICKDNLPAGFNIKTLTSRISFGGENGSVAHSYARARVRKMRDVYKNEGFIEPIHLKIAATELITWLMVLGHANDPVDNRKLLHHWLPLCYTKNFATHVFTSARGATIQQMYFNRDGSVKSVKTVRDHMFAHQKTEGGYYPTGMEQFFCRIENEYGDISNYSASRSAWWDIVLYAFFAVQSARNPDPHSAQNHSFGKAHKSRIVQGIFDALDNFDSPYVHYATGCTNLRFSPFFPPRLRKTMDGVTAMVFPMTVTTAFIIADADISADEAHRITEANALSMVRNSARRDEPLYGIE